MHPKALRARLKGDMNVALDLVGMGKELALTKPEQDIVARAYITDEGRVGNLRAGVLEEICSHHLVFADIEEDDYPDSSTPQMIREMLIQFLEREGGLQSNAGQWAEFLHPSK